MPAVLSDELTFKHRIGIVQTPGKVVRVIDESLNTGEDIVDKLVVGPIFDIANWRIYADDGSVDAATPLAAENTAIKVGPGKDVEFGDNFLIRFQLNELNIANPPLANYRLRKQVNGASSDLYNISANEKFNLGSSLNLTDGAAVTSSLLTSPGGTFETGEVIEDVNSPPRFFNHDFLKNGFTELVVVGTVLDSASGGSAVDGDLFRVGIQLEDGTEIFTSLIAEVDESVAGADHPNEPVGATFITERSFDTDPEDSWGAFSNSNASIVSDGTAPKSPSNVGRATYPEGHPGGTASHSCSLVWSRDKGISVMTTVYIHYWVKYSSNWQGHDSGVNKLLFVKGQENGNLLNSPIIMTKGFNTGPLRLEIRTQSLHFPNRNLLENVGSVNMTRDQWHEIEIILVMNSADGVADGEAHGWVNGTKVIEYTDVIHGDSAESSTWRAIHWNPTWGGTGDVTVAEMWHQLDHIYVSGIP